MQTKYFLATCLVMHRNLNDLIPVLLGMQCIILGVIIITDGRISLGVNEIILFVIFYYKGCHS